MAAQIPLTISSWSLGDRCRFAERVAAAKNAGFEGIGLRAETYVDARNEGLSDQNLLAILQRYQMRVTEVEYIVQWAEERRSYEQKYKEQICFHMCGLFQVGHINCGLMETYPVAYTAEKLRALCRRAGSLEIGVEPMPYSGIPDIQKGWDVVRSAEMENAKLILDSWHWMRANQPNDVALLAGIPPEKIVSIQINDVHRRPYAAAALREESMHDRLPPGAGAGDTAGFLRMIREKGIRPRTVAVEVISDAMLERGVDQAASALFDSTARLLAEVWPAILPEGGR